MKIVWHGIIERLLPLSREAEVLATPKLHITISSYDIQDSDVYITLISISCHGSFRN